MKEQNVFETLQGKKQQLLLATQVRHTTRAMLLQSVSAEHVRNAGGSCIVTEVVLSSCRSCT